jgi:large subunit ribosomal protein L10
MEKVSKLGRELKMHIVKEYTEKVKGSLSLFVTDFGGVTNKELEDLKKRLRGVSAKHLVVKNSLYKLALKDLKLDGISDTITGSCALSYGKGDPVSISKILVNFAKDNKNFKLRGAYIDGETITAGAIKELAALPGRDVLLAKLLGCLNSPISGFASVCSGIITKLLYALNEIAKTKEKNISD